MALFLFIPRLMDTSSNQYSIFPQSLSIIIVATVVVLYFLLHEGAENIEMMIEEANELLSTKWNLSGF